MTDDYVYNGMYELMRGADDACQKSKHVHTFMITLTLICMSNIYLRVILIFNGRKEIYHI